MVVPALILALAAASAPLLTPPLERGVAKNGAAVVAVPSTSPWTVVVVEVVRPDELGEDAVGAVLPAMAAAARSAVGKDGEVEVTWRPGSFALLVTTPASSPDLALRAIDAALKAARGAPPKTPAPLPAPWRGLREDRVAPSADVGGAFKALAGIGAVHVAIAVVGPGPGPELLRRARAAIAAPLARDAVRNRRGVVPRDDDKASHVRWPTGTPAEGAALEVIASLVGGHVHNDDGAVSLGFYGGSGRAEVAALVNATPPQAKLDDVARTRRLALAAAVDDPAALGLVLTSDALTGRDTFAVIDALALIDRDAVKGMAARLLEVLP